MTAVLNASHPPHSMYSSPPSSPSASSSHSTDWRQKYYEVNELLQETRNELDEFTRTSKELEEELEQDLERTERTQEELKQRAYKLEAERDEWKDKFLSMQQTHNTTVNSLQRELDTTRQAVQLYRDQVRELEMGNDDLERNERQAASSLQDVEQKYARALEDKILLEHELQDKASLEEACQRLKDELRDVNLEVAVLKDQVNEFKNLPMRAHGMSSHRDSTSSLPFSPSTGSNESLLRTEAPDLSLSDLLPNSPTISRHPSISSSLQSRISQEALYDDGYPVSPVSATSGSRPNSVAPPSLTSTPTQTQFLNRALSPTSSSISNASTRLPTPRARRPAGSPLPTSPHTPRIPVATKTNVPQARSKGVQMVSDMRARVKTLEQKLHSTMPKLRVTSAAAGPTSSPNPLAVGRARPPSRAAGSTLGAFKTPKRPPPTAPKEASPWVMIDDDGEANTTMRGPPSPEKPPLLPPVPKISPMIPGTGGRMGQDMETTSGIRPPSRTAGMRSVSVLGRSIMNHSILAGRSELSATHKSAPYTRSPPTAFPSISTKDQPSARVASAGTGPSVTFAVRPPSRIASLAITAAGARSAHRDPDSDDERPSTPSFIPQPQTTSFALRRAQTMSTPTKPKAHLTAGVLPRARRDSAQSPKALHLPSVNSKDAGTTPGKAKARNITSPDPLPPVPALPTSASSVVGNQRTIRPTSLGSPSKQSRIGRPHVSVTRQHAERDTGEPRTIEDEDTSRLWVKAGRSRSGTTGAW